MRKFRIILSLVCASALLYSWPVAPAYAGGKGYRIIGNRVVISDKEHWEAWKLINDFTGKPLIGKISDTDVVEITDDGKIGPRFIRKSTEATIDGKPVTIPGINACLDAKEFVYKDMIRKIDDVRGGVRDVGSNREAAFDPSKTTPGDTTWTIMDGDLDTWWGPDFNDPLRKWWIEVDLGRLVTATKIILRFVEEDLGDPFKQFAVFVSSGDRAFPKSLTSTALDYRLVYKTKKPSKDQRVFEIELKPLDKPMDFEGAAIQYVQVYVTDSDFDRAEEVSERGYRALDPERRGAVEYFRRTPSGREMRVTEEEYKELPLERKGRIIYYRRELPKLAELEVWSVGDNISLGILERGGSINVTGAGTVANAFDGYFPTLWFIHVWSRYLERGVMTVDLGVLMWVDTINIINGDDWLGDRALDGYEMKGSDGSRRADGTLVWEVLSQESRLDLPGTHMYGPMRIRDTLDPPRKLRLFEFKNIDVTGRRSGAYHAYASVAEIQIYGEGYAPELNLVSDWIGVGESENLTLIGWEADTPPGTEIELRTRTAEEVEEIYHWYNRFGKEVTEKEWKRLPEVKKGKRTVDVIITGSSGWSYPYKISGAKSPSPITSPSPRKWLQIQARLLSDDPYKRASLDRITIDFLPPVAAELFGEIGRVLKDGLYALPEEISPTVPHDFSYFIRSRIESWRQGFDDITLKGPSSFKLLKVRTGQVRFDTLSVFVGGSEVPVGSRRFVEALSPVEDAEGLFLSASGDSLAVVDTLFVGRGDTTEVVTLESIIFRETFSDADKDGVFVNASGEVLTLMPTGPDSLWIRLPRQVRMPVKGWDAIVEVQFRSRATLNPSGFSASVANSRVAGSWQKVRDKDATKLISGQTSTVSVSIGERLIEALSIQPRTITPNGDGVNDEMAISFTVLKLNVEKPVEVTIYNLGGEVVKRLRETRPVASGDYMITWFGDDESGQRVLPGIYVCQIRVHADSGDAAVSRAVCVAY